MDNLARFSDYDVFAYLASGLASLMVWDMVFSTKYVIGAQWTVAGGVITIAAAYIIGQILAAPSGWLIERQFVRHVLLRPSVILMGGEIGWRKILKRTLLQDYYSPLDKGLQDKVRERVAAERDPQVSGDALFWRAFPVAKRDANAYARMSGFLNLYGFCRNMAFVGVVGACFIALVAALEWAEMGWSKDLAHQFRWALLALLIGLGMLHRYLKFFRLYAVEVFVTYGDASSGGGKNE